INLDLPESFEPTSGAELDRTIGTEFIDAIIHLLRAHPQAVYLATGEGELSWQKRRFESAGVGKRVGYTGKRKDLPGFLRIADVYLAEFPIAGTTGVLHAMSMERPVVAMQWSDAPEHAAAARLVGEESAIGGRDANAFIERVSKLIREPAYRAKLGKSMRTRVEQQFAFNQTARQIESWCAELLGRTEATAGSDAPANAAKPTAFAA
ncbi:MAG TPA: glycosyltransferase, partial [Tepidisphaeraceae bacterium]|nr:glycosyltransferase [Tepidisphaeraceae bacterium]